MQFTQDLVHKLEVGGGMRYLRMGLAALAVLGVVVMYNVRSFKNFSTREAMDTAQLGRNLAEGKGYTTLFIRPFSMYLLRQHHQVQPGALDTTKPADLAQIKDRHPDLANPPVYPLMLAGLLKIMPFDYSMQFSKPFWSNAGKFWRHPPEFCISVFNQLLFFGLIVLMFFLVRRLFEPRVAWLSVILIFGTELFWRFNVSGLSTMLMLVIFTGLVWCLVLIEQEGRELARGQGRMIALAVLAGLLTSLGCLTRYSFGWLILPVVLFLVLFGGPPRIVLAIAALVVFFGALTPWVIRNYQVSGTPFGTAGYAILEGGGGFLGDTLQRSLSPDFNAPSFRALTQKLLLNLRQMLITDLPRLGGSWITAFFIVGLFIPFREPGARRLRYFLLSALAVLILVQALGRTELPEAVNEISTENLLVLLAPLVLAYGVSFFYVVLDQVELPIRELRYAIIGVFSAAVCLPMLFTFLPPHGIPLAFPPYYPPNIQTLDSWVKENELTMSDMPWAVAWYAQRQSIWLPTAGPADFIDINDYQKPVQALLLGHGSLDGRFQTDWNMALEGGWGNFILQVMMKSVSTGADSSRWPKQFSVTVRQPSGPTPFPLHWWQSGFPDLLILTSEAPPRKAL
jgi:hypothetical protein